MTPKLKKIFVGSISLQIIIIILIGMLASAVIQYIYYEETIEESMLDHVKKQAYVFLLGVERQVQSLADPYDVPSLDRIFKQASVHDAGSLDFSIINVYMYNTEGVVVSYLIEPESLEKDMEEFYGRVIEQDKPYLGEKIEEHHYGESDAVIPTTDIIIPMHYGDEIIGGLEVEIDIEKTFAMIREMDDKYEKQISSMLLVVIAMLSLFVLLVMYWRLILPVRKISAVTGRIAKGDLEARIGSRAGDEIGHLSASIDEMADSIKHLFAEIDSAYLGILNSLSTALQARDDYTANHAENVTKYSLLLGKRIGLDEDHIQTLAQGSMLHDIGKIGVPDNILNKAGKLTDEEQNVMQDHPDVTSRILDPLEKFKHFSEIAKSHHERWDGQGYPDGLKGEEIPLLARIVSIADTWDAMTSDRGYRKGMSAEKALSILEKEKDLGQWDPHLLEEFIKLIREQGDTNEEDKTL